ncbi:MAG: EutN/CcmL family microcompartment protein [Planctomycetota bacterium]|jgi:microcompartment protein CcmK/EutM
MIFCRVVGTIVASIKNDRLVGEKLLLCQPVDLKDQATGNSFVAIDRVQAGVGDLVLTNKEGGGARIVYADNKTPIQQMVVAVVDQFDVSAREGMTP